MINRDFIEGFKVGWTRGWNMFWAPLLHPIKTIKALFKK